MLSQPDLVVSEVLSEARLRKLIGIELGEWLAPRRRVPKWEEQPDVQIPADTHRLASIRILCLRLNRSLEKPGVSKDFRTFAQLMRTFKQDRCGADLRTLDRCGGRSEVNARARCGALILSPDGEGKESTARLSKGPFDEAGVDVIRAKSRRPGRPNLRESSQGFSKENLKYEHSIETSRLRSLLELVRGSALRWSVASRRPTRSRCSHATRII